MTCARMGWSRSLRLGLIYFGVVIALGGFWGALVAVSNEARAEKKKPPAHELDDSAIEISATPIASFDRASTAGPRFGQLEWRGGLVLTSTNRFFGGWSALVMAADGRRLLAISDVGLWLTAEVTYQGERPTGLKAARIGPLRDGDGQPFRREKDRDSEGLAVVSGTLEAGEALISFERRHRIGRFPISAEGVGPLRETLKLPAQTARLATNKSLESVCVLKGGRMAGSVVTLAERFPSADGQHVGWLQAGGDWRTLAIANVEGFDLTDCHGLADGSMLVLERRFRFLDWVGGVRMRLRRFSAEDIASGRLMSGTTLIEASTAQHIDNMEGLAVHTGARGETVLTLISDDNFNHLLQRTVLLQFALVEEPKARATETSDKATKR